MIWLYACYFSYIVETTLTDKLNIQLLNYRVMKHLVTFIQYSLATQSFYGFFDHYYIP